MLGTAAVGNCNTMVLYYNIMGPPSYVQPVVNRNVVMRRMNTCKRNSKARSRNHSNRGKAVSITYSESVSVDLVIQHAQRMRRIIFSSVACPTLQYFSTLSHKRQDFRKKNILSVKCVF